MKIRTTLAAALFALLALCGAAQAAETKRIMVFGDSNSWGWVPVERGFPSTRYPAEVRWPGVMQQALGSGYTVIDEALNARTTDLADPTLPLIEGAGLDGSAYLPAALASQLPLDVVVIMVGTNDLKAMFHRSAARIALGAGKLADIARTINGGVGTEYPNPKVLLIAPPPLGQMGVFRDMFAGGEPKSRELAPAYAEVAKAAGVDFLDAGSVIRTDGVDGLHFSEKAQHDLGIAVADKVKAMTR